MFLSANKNTKLSIQVRSIVDKIDSVMHNSSFGSFKGVVLIEYKNKIAYHESFGENIKRNRNLSATITFSPRE